MDTTWVQFLNMPYFTCFVLFPFDFFSKFCVIYLDFLEFVSILYPILELSNWYKFFYKGLRSETEKHQHRIPSDLSCNIMIDVHVFYFALQCANSAFPAVSKLDQFLQLYNWQYLL